MTKTNGFDRLIAFLEKLVEWVSIVLLAICVGSSLLQIISRTIIGKPLTWCEEVARFSGVWMIMWAMGLVFKARGHIGVDFFYSKMSRKVQRVLDPINDLFTICLMILFTYFSAQLMVNGYGTKAPSLRIPMGFIYSGMVSGAGLSVLFAIYAAIQNLRKNAEERKNGSSDSKEDEK